MDILTLLKLRMNFTTTNVFDDNFGVKRDSGTWNGIIGKLVNHNIDLIAAELSITPEREEVNHKIFAKIIQISITPISLFLGW